MNSLQRWQQRLQARLARPQPFFLDAKSAAGVAPWCAAHGGESVDLVVSAPLLHELVCEPGLPLDDEAALHAYARQLFGHYFGAPAQRWAIATWAAGEQRGASALHGLDWPALAESARAAQVDVRRIRPAWSAVLQKLAVDEPGWRREPAAALAWVEGQVLTWVQLRDGEVQALRQLRLPDATQAALGEALAELREGPGLVPVLALGYGLDAGAMPVWPGVRVLTRLDGSTPDLAWFESPAAPNTALPQPDFLGPRVARSPLAWPLAAVGALALALAGSSLWGSQQGLGEAQRQMLLNKAQIGPVTLPTSRPAATRPTPAQAQAQAQPSRAAAEVQALLQTAWEPLLANVEQAGAQAQGLSWLGLDYSAGRNELRLEGLTQDKLMALKLVDRLAAAPGWQGVVLSRFQTGEQGLSGQRFELSAKLSPSLLKPELLAAKAQP